MERSKMCAPSLHPYGAIRASFQVYNDASDVKTLIDALAVEL
jgi:selenocysteine lyase/cysteine desulfurase